MLNIKIDLTSLVGLIDSMEEEVHLKWQGYKKIKTDIINREDLVIENFIFFIDLFSRDDNFKLFICIPIFEIPGF